MDDNEDFEPSQWRNGQWVPCSQRSRLQSSQESRERGSQPGPGASQRRPSQASRPAPTPVNVTPDLTAQLLSLLQSAAKATPAKEKKPKVNENERIQCLLCASTLATKTTLFRHYKTQHLIPNPALFLGYQESNVVNLDTTLEECECRVCGLVVPNSHVLNVHMKVANHNTADNNPRANSTTAKHTKERCNECAFEANNRHELEVHSRIHASSSAAANNSANVSNAPVNNGGTVNGDPNKTDTNKNNGNKTLVDSLHKCDECHCYFDDEKIFNEHMKVHQHQTGCHICNKNLLFKDYDDHVKNNHPDVYSTKNKVEGRKERNAVMKMLFRKKSGKISCVFKCKECSSEFKDEGKARRHAEFHNKRLKMRTVANNTDRRVHNVNVNESLPEVKDIVYTCEACKISTASYDVVVEHSQSHITDPNAQFVTKTCERCNLKFEPICYDRHLTRHYIEENLQRDSFTHLEYKYYLLLSVNWLNFFNMEEAEIQQIVSKSIYAHTRSVRMRVVSVSGRNASISNLYQCGKCKHFVDPSSVANHTRNYDTCVKITDEFPCEVCQRPFSASKALENHLRVHDDDVSFRIVVFNTEMDKEFNLRLNDINNTGVSSTTAEDPSNANPMEPNNDAGTSNNNVLYKCRCLLCFVVKETAEDHMRVCPGKDPRQNCQKCNYLFNYSELMIHYMKHHTSNDTATFVVEDIVPDAIEVVSDTEPERDINVIDVIDLSDDDEIEQRNIEAQQPSDTGCVDDSMEITDSDDEVGGQNDNTLKKSNTQAEVLPVTKIKNEVNVEKDDFTNRDNDNVISGSGSIGIVELTDDTDSQDTIIEGEHAESTDAITNTESSQLQSHILANNTALKCVPTDFLVNPFYRTSNRVIEAHNVKKEVESEIETVRKQIEVNGVDSIQITSIKKENPWSYVNEPSNFTSISKRPPLRSVVTSSICDIPVYDLLTDDDETSDDLISREGENDTNSETPMEDSFSLNQIAPDQEELTNNNPQQTGIMSENNLSINVNDQNDDTIQNSVFNEEIDGNSIIDWVVVEDTATQNDSNVMLCDNAVECKENLNTSNKMSTNDNAIIATNTNLELVELNKIKQRLLAISEENITSEYESLYQNAGGSVIKELSLSAVFERPAEVYENNIRFNIEYNNSNKNSLKDEVIATNFISDGQTERNTYEFRNNESTLDVIEALGVSSNNTMPTGNAKQDARIKKAFAVVNSDKKSGNSKELVRKTVITQNEQNIETVICSPNVRTESFSIRLSSRPGIRQNDNNCTVS